MIHELGSSGGVKIVNRIQIIADLMEECYPFFDPWSWIKRLNKGEQHE